MQKNVSSPRGAYVTLLKSRRNRSIEQTRQAYLGQGGSHNARACRKQDRSCETQQTQKTDRQKSLNKSHSNNRQSASRVQQIKTTRRFSKLKLKKDLSSWSKACISLSKDNYDEERKKNKEGSNCRLVVMLNGKAQYEHFLQVHQTSQVLKTLSNLYPNATNFVTVPRQISLEFMLRQLNISGAFLNGQSLYIKPDFQNNATSSTITLQDFQIIKQIGSGGFSQVFLCRSKRDNNFYAMKLIEKDMVIKNKKKKIVMNQRNIMVSSKHPFIIDLKHAFQAEKYIVFVVEYCAGGELFGLIKKYRRLSEEMARFYIIEIFLGLAYLHNQKVVYRDIKPENILLGIDGHVKIADLGLAKPEMHEGELAYSFCGSPQYMSPQMIMQVGHTYPVDYYCMGALLYELLTGLPPFYSQDPNEIYEAVLAEQLTFPDDVALTSECRSLLKSLLNKDPKHRLGSLYGTKQILTHPWFGKQKYQDYIDKKVQPPINFKHLEKINLDASSNEKNHEILERTLKNQKYEGKEFKNCMKNFYFDLDGEKKQLSNRKSKQRAPSPVKTQVSSRDVENKDIIRKMKKKGAGLLVRNPLQTMFNR